jgi:hypothetical protein
VIFLQENGRTKGDINITEIISNPGPLPVDNLTPSNAAKPVTDVGHIRHISAETSPVAAHQPVEPIAMELLTLSVATGLIGSCSTFLASINDHTDSNAVDVHYNHLFIVLPLTCNDYSSVHCYGS